MSRRSRRPGRRRGGRQPRGQQAEGAQRSQRSPQGPSEAPEQAPAGREAVGATPAEPAAQQEPASPGSGAQPPRRGGRRRTGVRETARRRAREAAAAGGRRRGGRGLELTSAIPWVLGGGVLLSVLIVVVVVATGGGSSGGAVIGDHWHAAVSFNVCGQGYTEPVFEDDDGIHTHGDGVIHIHPRTGAASGKNASLRTYFRKASEHSGFQIGPDFIQLPGDQRLDNGDLCPDGRPGTVRLVVNGHEAPEGLDYLPQDGDRIQVTFN